MKFVLGLIVGVGGAWLYRAWGQLNMPDDAPDFVERARESISNIASAAAPRAAEIIDQTPIPPHAEDVASSAPSTAGPPMEAAGPVAATGPKARTKPRRSGTQPTGDAAPEADQSV
jgi:hypothetical protein